MICAKWHKSFTIIIFLLLYLNNVVQADINGIKYVNEVNTPDQQDFTNEKKSNYEINSNEEQSENNNNHNAVNHTVMNETTMNNIPMSGNSTEQLKVDKHTQEYNDLLNSQNVANNMEKYFIRKRQDNANHTDVHTVDEKSSSHEHVEKNTIANVHSMNNEEYKNVQGEILQTHNYGKENLDSLLSDVGIANRDVTAQDEAVPGNSTGDGAGSSTSGGGSKNGENSESQKRHSDKNEGGSSNSDSRNDEQSVEQKGHTNNEQNDSSSPKDSPQNGLQPSTSAKLDDQNKDGTSEQPSSDTDPSSSENLKDADAESQELPSESIDHADKIKNTLLKERRDIKETTSMIDNAVYNIENLILQTKFYTTAIKNFVHFKVNHICEYSKCGSNARCYIIEKDKEECRCRANYFPDDSVNYFKCIPKTVKDCSKDNGNCDINAECSIDSNNNIKCQCNFNYIGDGIFCVIGSQAKQSLYFLLILLICLLHMFFFF
ncbi:merozoite surface protein 10 [Plasmodium gonderi]|uniref:Merozoite surface protein 10 n=1 Tax=Plasmodium gonderi TaxID=77519 RepID=A0A1Y1JN51_PLAGO|nr:merozoite surface protein 10 [Plasmodium gonderi]GAW81823.1 merozoite surface protein 10 [Plasmodium gonderi]